MSLLSAAETIVDYLDDADLDDLVEYIRRRRHDMTEAFIRQATVDAMEASYLIEGSDFE